MSCEEYDCSKKPRPVFHQGASALDIEFPDAATTEWMVGGRHEVAWATKGRHRGGYTYRLCKIPKEGKKDLTEGTYPIDSAWRHIVKIVKSGSDAPQILRKDVVIVPDNLPEGDYVLSFRWDTQAAQVWVSCSNIKLVHPTRK